MGINSLNKKNFLGYRSLSCNRDLIPTHVREEESDLYILANCECSAPARRALRYWRGQLADYLRQHPLFRESLLPLAVEMGSSPIVREMAVAASCCGVGPMSAVAGALAGYVGSELLSLSPEIIVENGGDIYLVSRQTRTVAIYAGEKNPLTARLGIMIRPEQTPLGIATSSGTLGRSFSWGGADAAVVVAKNPSLADAAATALANRIYSSDEAVWSRAAEWVQGINGIKGSLIVMGGKIQARGEIELVELKRDCK